jgi:hypothetical protein
MNNKKQKKTYINAEILITHLYLNKQLYTPKKLINGQAKRDTSSLCFYFDKKNISKRLHWTEIKAWRILQECMKLEYVRKVSEKYWAGHFSKMYEFYKFNPIENTNNNTIINETEELYNRKLESSYIVPNNDFIFENVGYHKKHIKYLKSEIIIGRGYNGYSRYLINKIEQDTVNYINQTNKSNCEHIEFNEYIKIRKTDKRYTVVKSCRATSLLCSSNSDLARPLLLKRLGLFNEFDIHSAVPSLFRLLNKHKFSADWDIKDIMIKKLQKNIPEINRGGLK